MADFGQTTLQLLLLLSTFSGALALVGGRRRSRVMLEAAKMSLYATALLASLAMVVLAYAFVVSDFSLTYVQHYSDRAMPFFYRLTAVWGGQEGSLLFWVWLLAIGSALAVRLNQERLREIIPHAIVVLMVVQVFFCLLLLLMSNPFDTFLGGTPSDGRGLNPLLLNPYMVIHPPALYLGYVGMAIPFAFAMGALIAGRTDERWIRAARPWALGSWAFLSLGLVLGMLWAYEELGWGGYWAWDPVENAGLIPWLTATAYLHSAMVQERRGLFKVWNVVLAVLTFVLTILGTFDTRSGFIQSVHAFARSEIGYYFLGFIVLTVIVSAAIIIWRLPLLRARVEVEVMSREFFFVIVNWVLLVAALLVIALTHLPPVSQLFGSQVSVKPAIFTRWMTPIGLALLFLKGLGPMLTWRRPARAIWKGVGRAPLILVGATVALLVVIGARRPLPLLTFALVAFVLGAVGQEIVLGARLRRRRTGADPATALCGLFARNRRRYGGYLVHAGVALMFIGFGGEGYKQESEFMLKRGQRADIGRYTLRFDGARFGEDEQKNTVTMSLSVYRGGERLGTLHPARWVYSKFEGQPSTKVDIVRSVREDLFVALGSYDSGAEIAGFKALVNPLVSWIWIGFVLLCLGSLIALLPAGAPRPQPAEVADREKLLEEELRKLD